MLNDDLLGDHDPLSPCIQSMPSFFQTIVIHSRYSRKNIFIDYTYSQNNYTFIIRLDRLSISQLISGISIQLIYC